MFADAAEVADDLVYHGFEYFSRLAEMALLIQGGHGPVHRFPACSQVVTEAFPGKTQVLKVTPGSLDFVLQGLVEPFAECRQLAGRRHVSHHRCQGREDPSRPVGVP